MIQVLKVWYYRYLSDPQAVVLIVLLLFSFTVLMTMGGMLAPVLVSIVLAYLLDGVAQNLERFKVRRLVAVLFVYFIFIMLLLFVLLVLLPLLSHQLSQLIQELPSMVNKGRQLLLQLPERYPDFISAKQVEGMMNTIGSNVRAMGQQILSYSLASIPTIIALLVYVILVPLLVFFFLKDRDVILEWVVDFLPKERTAAKKVWLEMDIQIGNYIRGKVYEIFIVGLVSYIPFSLMGLNFASLLAVLVGLSVIVPYIGAVAVTFPVVFVAYFQWGLGSDFVWVIIAYSIVQAADGNVLVPLLFSEAVNLHPVAIIMAVLVFGGLWGFWGVFFAIPLATLVKALLAIWPRVSIEDNLKKQSPYP